ncbi:MAG: glycosyltransferase family 4 protein [Nitrososphaerales archaeon]
MNLLITADYVGELHHGGGVVTANEANALRRLDNLQVIHKPDLNPSKYSLPNEPFIIDYIADGLVGNILEQAHVTLAHFYAGTFSKTIRRLRTSGTIVTYTAAAHDRKLSIEEFESINGNYPYNHIKDDFLWSMYVEGYKQANLVICPSNLSMRIMRDYGCKNVVVIPHGVDIPKETKPLPKRFAVGYLGQVGPDKGLIYLLRAWRLLKYKDAILYLAGRDTTSLMPIIRRECTGNVHIIGFVQNICDLYNRCSVYVQPSVSEGFGIEVLEAMAHRRPVIVSEGAGSCDLVENGFNGFRVPIRNPQEIASYIDWYRSNQDKMIDMANNAYATALQYTWSNIRERYIKEWQNVLSSIRQ